MDRQSIQEILQTSQNLAQHLDGLVRSLRDAPGASLEEYVPDVEAAYARLKSGLGQSPDVVLRKLRVPALPQGHAMVAYIDGMADQQMVDQDIIAPLLATREPPDRWEEGVIAPGHVQTETRWDAVESALVGGNTLIFADGFPRVLVADTTKFKQRSIERPETEMSVRGPAEAFNEVILTQMNQIRRRIQTPALRFRQLKVGQVQQVAVVVAYLEGLTNPGLVETVVERVERIRVDGMPDASMVGGLIRDHPRSIFPTIRATERVDVACWRLLEGKVVILVDGDPSVLIAPAPLADFYRTAMDYTTPWYDATFVRFIRWGGWALGVYLPAVYIALTEVNVNLVPAALLTLVAGAHAGLPFPPVGEALLMIFVIEVLREAALRLPKVLSTTIGTVGAIVVGTAVVKAGLVSPQVIVLITLTALSFYSVPVYELTGTWRLVNFAMLMAGAILGVLGIVLVSMLLVGELTAMSSFGTPYFEPFAPFRRKDFQDMVWRLPYSAYTIRATAARPGHGPAREPAEGFPPPHLMRRQPGR